jgi:hypothetical protein
MIPRKSSVLAVGLLAAAVTAITAHQARKNIWLDEPLTSWNRQGAAIPPAPAGALKDPRNLVCGDFPFPSPEEAARTPGVTEAGWLRYLHFDRVYRRDDVEIVAGLAKVTTPGCEPGPFNLFVFVGGRFAGTVSPVLMTSRTDGAAGAVRITGPDSLSVEFARYLPADTECCPSSHVRVTYRIDRSGPSPVVVPVEIRQVRG